MKINIVSVGNREWLDFKSDIAYGLYYSLKSLKHDVSMSINQFDTKSLNLIVGADFICDSPNSLTQLFRSKIDYSIFEVEYFDGKTINFRPNFKLGNYQALVRNAKFVLTPYKANLASYSDLCDSDQIRYARWGFYDQLVDTRIVRGNTFFFEGLFFGLLKGDRAKKISYLTKSRERKIKILSRNDPLTIKDYYLSISKWGLNLSYGVAERFINPFRLYQMAANGMPILADASVDEDGYLNLCEVMEFNKFHEAFDMPLPLKIDLEERAREHDLAENLSAVM